MIEIDPQTTSQSAALPLPSVVQNADGRTYEVLDLEHPNTKASTAGWKYVAYGVACIAVGILWIPLKILFIIPNTVSYISNYSLKGLVA